MALIPSRPQQYRLQWPLTPEQVENIDTMFETLFKRAQLLTTQVNATSVVGITGPAGPPGMDNEGSSGLDNNWWPSGITMPAASLSVAGLSGSPGRDGESGEDNIWWPCGITPAIVAEIDRAAIATTSTDGFVLENPTPSTAGIPVQISPRLRWRSHVWNTTAVAADNTDDWFIESIPTSALLPIGQLSFSNSRNGAAAKNILMLTSNQAWISSAGVVRALFNSSTGLQFGQDYYVGWCGNADASGAAADTKVVRAGGAGLLNITATTNGIGFDVATDAVLKVRTRAQTGYATVDALGYKASGTAGVSFGPAAVASITVVNGIVTAIS